MSTITEIIDRCYREYLRPPSNQPPVTRLTGDIGTSDTSLTLNTALLSAEELSLIDVGSVLEIGQEWMRVVTFTATSGATTVTRGIAGTTSGGHATTDEVLISPEFSRKVVFDAVSDALVGLWPDLYAIEDVMVDSSDEIAELDATVRAVIAVETDDGELVDSYRFRRSIGSLDGAPGVTFSRPVGDVWVTVKRAFPRPTAEADELTGSTFLFPSEWDEILVVTVAGKLLVGKVPDRTTFEYLSQALEAAGIRISEVADASMLLLRYREILVKRAARGVATERPIEVVFENPVV